MYVPSTSCKQRTKEAIGRGDGSEEEAITHSTAVTDTAELNSHLLKENKLILHVGTLVDFIFISATNNSGTS